MSKVVAFSKQRGKSADIPDALRKRCETVVEWYVELDTFQKAGAGRSEPSLSHHLSVLTRLDDDTCRSRWSALLAYDSAPALTRYRDALREAGYALAAAIEEIESRRPQVTDEEPPMVRKKTPRKTMTLFILRIALEWRSHGLKPSAGREGKFGYRVSPFQTYIWHLSQELPEHIRPDKREKFANSVESALRTFKLSTA